MLPYTPSPAANTMLFIRRPLAYNFTRRLWATSIAARALQTAITPDSSVDDAIEAACHKLGRPPGAAEAELVAKLKANWFFSAADVATMTHAQAASLGLPLKLLSTIADGMPREQPQPQPEPQPSPGGDSLGGSFASNGIATALLPEDEALVALSVDAVVTGSESDSEAGWEALPIEQRVCPPLNRFGHRYSEQPKVVKRRKIVKYALGKAELPPALVDEFAALHRFGTQRFFGAQAEPIAEVTAAKYADHLRGMLGWMHRTQGEPLAELSLRRLVPSPDRSGVAPTFDYVQWLVAERDISTTTELLVLRSVLYAAKFIYHDVSQVRPSSGDKPYSDLEVIKEFRGLINVANKASKVAPRVADEAAKWLDWPQYLKLCRELRREAAAMLPDGYLRKNWDIAWSLQKFLIFQILACVPDRQRTLRELEVGRTLFKEGGRWLIRHGPKDYKTGRSYGERPPLVLSPALYPELEAFVATWRAELHPEHSCLFTQANGQPFTDKQMYKMFKTTAYRITGAMCTPHLVRDMIVTHLRGSDASEKELEALALYMGHSVAMQRSSYDRRTKQQKVEPAVALLESLNDDQGSP